MVNCKILIAVASQISSRNDAAQDLEQAPMTVQNRFNIFITATHLDVLRVQNSLKFSLYLKSTRNFQTFDILLDLVVIMYLVVNDVMKCPHDTKFSAKSGSKFNCILEPLGL